MKRVLISICVMIMLCASGEIKAQAPVAKIAPLSPYRDYYAWAYMVQIYVPEYDFSYEDIAVDRSYIYQVLNERPMQVRDVAESNTTEWTWTLDSKVVSHSRNFEIDLDTIKTKVKNLYYQHLLVLEAKNEYGTSVDSLKFTVRHEGEPFYNSNIRIDKAISASRISHLNDTSFIGGNATEFGITSYAERFEAPHKPMRINGVRIRLDVDRTNKSDFFDDYTPPIKYFKVLIRNEKNGEPGDTLEMLDVNHYPFSYNRKNDFLMNPTYDPYIRFDKPIVVSGPYYIEVTEIKPLIWGYHYSQYDKMLWVGPILDFYGPWESGNTAYLKKDGKWMQVSDFLENYFAEINYDFYLSKIKGKSSISFDITPEISTFMDSGQYKEYSWEFGEEAGKQELRIHDNRSLLGISESYVYAELESAYVKKKETGEIVDVTNLSASDLGIKVYLNKIENDGTVYYYRFGASLEALPADLSERHWIYNFYVRYWLDKDEHSLKLVTLDITQRAGESGIETVEIDNEESELSVYPTVANSIVNIDMPKMRRIEVFDLCGAKVADYSISGNTYEMNVSEWNSGVYVMLVHTAKDVHTAKFVKK